MFVTWKATKLNSLVISSRGKNLFRRMKAIRFTPFSWDFRMCLTELFKLEKTPSLYGLIQIATRNKRIYGLELCTDYIAKVACQDSQRATVLPIPNSHSLIIAIRKNPWQLSIQLNYPHVVQMALECEHASLYHIVPNLDHVIINSGNKYWLGITKPDSLSQPYR